MNSLKEISLGSGFVNWSDEAYLPEGNWTHNGITKTETELYTGYKNNVNEWAGTWTRELTLKSISFMNLTEQIELGETLQLEVIHTPENVPIGTLNWTSSNEAVATVDQNGVVTAVGIGTATITAATTDGTQLTATCEVTVKEPTPEFSGHSMVLSGQIGVDFGIKLPDEVEQYEGSYFIFTIGEGEKQETKRIEFDSSNKLDDTRYKGTVYISSIRMADKIVPEFHYTVDGEERVIAGEAYSAEDYIKEYMAVLGEDERYSKMTAIIKSLADYGHYSQPSLSETNGWVIGEDYAEMGTYYTESYDYSAVREASEEYALQKPEGSEKIGDVKVQLRFGDEVTLYVYIYPKEGAELSVEEIETSSGKAEKLSSGVMRVTMAKIKASRLAEERVIVAAGEEIEVSAMTYVNVILKSSSETITDKLRDTVCALYNYAQACNNYQN